MKENLSAVLTKMYENCYTAVNPTRHLIVPALMRIVCKMSNDELMDAYDELEEQGCIRYINKTLGLVSITEKGLEWVRNHGQMKATA